MGTPGDKFPVGKVVFDESATEASETPELTTETTDVAGQSDMTVLQNVPSLGIFIEHDLDQHVISEQSKDLLSGETSLTLQSLEDLEKQLLLDTTSESENSSSNVPLLVDTFTNLGSSGEKIFTQTSTSGTQVGHTQQSDLSIPGPSGLQTPKATKPMPTLVKILPKRNKKPPLGSQTPKKPHQCPACNKTFQSSTKLASHQLVHTGGTPFKCEHCKKSFSSKFKLVRHVLIHSDRKPFSCTVCERTFHRKDHLKNHIKVHSPSKKVYVCERTSCRKQYTSVMSYRKHLALHAAEDGSLDCKICSKVFESKADILYHLKIHAGSRTVKNPNEKKFTCDYCERRFFTRKDVRRHLVVHTGTRNFLCQFCPQRFGRKDHLVRHIKKSHSKNYTELDIISTDTSQAYDVPETPQVLDIPDTSQQSESSFVAVKVESKLDIPQIAVENILEYTESKSDIKLEEIPEVQNLLFSRSFTELSPMLCAESETLPYMSHRDTETELLPQEGPLPSASELLSELDVIKEELEQGITRHEPVTTGTSGSSSLIHGELTADMDELQSQQLLPGDMMESDLLRLISEGNTQLSEDESNLPLPGFSQVFKQQDPPS